ncbi:MAG: hypothetical protein RQ982_07710, partial [Gammaproteobacteria bacterium]|nr:hypothetical protein [Gammaproteobacteria bacterium]
KELQLQTANKKTRQRYHQHYLDRERQLKSFCRKNRIHIIPVSTADDILETLKKGLGIKGTLNASSHRSQFRSA